MRIALTILLAAFGSLQVACQIHIESVREADEFEYRYYSSLSGFNSPDNVNGYNSYESLYWGSNMGSEFQELEENDDLFLLWEDVDSTTVFIDFEMDRLDLTVIGKDTPTEAVHMRITGSLIVEDMWGRTIVEDDDWSYDWNGQEERADDEDAPIKAWGALVEICRREGVRIHEDKSASVQALDRLPMESGKASGSDMDIMKNAVMIAASEDIHGTALLIDNSGYFIADYRLFSDEDTLAVHTQAGDTLNATLVRIHRQHNLALGKIEGTAGQAPSGNLDLTWKPEYFIELTSFGTMAKGVGGGFSKGNINAISKEDGWFMTNVASQLGFTGSGIYDDKGALVAVCIAKRLNSSNSVVMYNYPIAQILEELGINLSAQ